jgi:hypothetical protein
MRPTASMRQYEKVRRALGDDAEAPRFIATVPVRGYRFIAIAYEASAGSLRNRPSQMSLIGRENEMSSLRAVLEEAASGQGSIFLIHGEPGIGKTRVTEVLTSLAQANRIAAFAGHCVEQDETVPYLPFVEMLENWVDTCPTTDAVREMVGPEGPECVCCQSSNESCWICRRRWNWQPHRRGVIYSIASVTSSRGSCEHIRS